jgi:hypothetical protein
LVLSSDARCLELSTVPDYGGESKSGPVYPRGQLIEGLNLVVENVDKANSKTFELLKPRRRADYNPDESVRYALAPGAHKSKPFELVEPLEDIVAVNRKATHTPELNCAARRRRFQIGESIGAFGGS